MKVFISWSGDVSRELAEVLRDWLPQVVQAAKPYFTPNDVEKGARWSQEIASELETSHVGILCLTRENVESPWLLFEAGALSKSLDKARVCPMLFGISNAEVSGPLRQFQTTSFQKTELKKLVALINHHSDGLKLTEKALDAAFEKWWPDLEESVKAIVESVSEPAQPLRSDRELLEEVLELSRQNLRRSVSGNPSPAAVRDLMAGFIDLHNSQAREQGDYQDTLNQLRAMHKPVMYLASRADHSSSAFQNALAELKALSFRLASDDDEFPPEEDLPF